MAVANRRSPSVRPVVGDVRPGSGHWSRERSHAQRYTRLFGPTVCKTVRPMLSDRCPVLSVCLSVCDVGVLWPNGWMDQNETWHGGRPWPRPHWVRWGPSPPPKGAQQPPSWPISIVAKRLPISATAELLSGTQIVAWTRHMSQSWQQLCHFTSVCKVMSMSTGWLDIRDHVTSARARWWCPVICKSRSVDSWTN